MIAFTIYYAYSLCRKPRILAALILSLHILVCCALGGIISPLLSNIVLNELDWWLSNQWETIPTKHKYTQKNKYSALKKSKLKEFYFVRYSTFKNATHF